MILMVTIRRAALDEFWSREPVIIRGNLTTGKQLRRVTTILNPFPLWL